MPQTLNKKKKLKNAPMKQKKKKEAIYTLSKRGKEEKKKNADTNCSKMHITLYHF